MILLFLGSLLFRECMYATCKKSVIFVPSVYLYLSYSQIRALIAYVLDRKLEEKKNLNGCVIPSQFNKVFGSLIPNLFLTYQNF